ncbi:MAG: pyridoxine 5'-phosphate synthase [Phycisphaerales bacterium]|nr:pyridoxine 5'-phosphate synthase [Phycisphaerales bacterium]
MARVSVNIDHIATIRQARRTWEPDPVAAAAEVEAGGAAGVTVHLREDRRHIQDADVEQLARTVRLPLNLEIAATSEMVNIARHIKPATAMLVPEGRLEITTEGGLDVAGQQSRLQEVVASLREAGIPASAFIDAQLEQVEAAASCGFAICEVHTGPWAHAFHDDPDADSTLAELATVAQAGKAIIEAGMQFNAGHALGYANVAPVASLPGLHELHIGHAIVSRAVFSSLRVAVSDMVAIVEASQTT